MQVEVAYARPDKQQIVPVKVPEGTTALEAVKLSGIGDIFPEIEPDTIDMGVFGKVIKETEKLQHELDDQVQMVGAFRSHGSI